MYFYVDIIPTNLSLENDSQWKAVKEPKKELFFVLAYAMAIIVPAIVVALYWLFQTELLSDLYQRVKQDKPTALFIFVLIYATHELVHAISLPKFGLDGDTKIIFLKKNLTVAIYYMGELSKSRFIFYIASPFVVLTVVPIAMNLFFSSPWFAYVAILNASISAGDILSIFFISKGTPKNSLIQNSGWRSYFKPALCLRDP